MNKITTFGIAISIVLALVTFIASNNFIVAGVILTLSLLYFFLLANRIVKKYLVKVDRFHSCYHFINTFIVSLSIKGTVSSAYESTMDTMNENFKKEIENVEVFSQADKLEHLNKYFKFHVFSLFIDFINIYQEQGGDVLAMSSYLLNEIKDAEEYISTSISLGKKKLTEFAILWLLTLGIMVFLRFSLSQFFVTISKHLFYPIGILVISMFCLITIHFAIMKFTKLKIRGWDDNEKI